ncbi:DUF4908 domain-containing protein [Brevundimonas fluminis]|jgi:hypothetical protein|uniref:DUF4908 domain-containing protein n=1 Tax=Brevundimonas fluminis TaxID=2487274 RepID=UPI000F658187|nr:DUF4908 domain-containing protein [Brevundimonas fluminis]
MKSSVRLRTAFAPLLTATALAVAGLGLCADAAAAQSGAILRGEAPGRSRQAMPETGRYVAETGQSFVLDRSGPRTLMRFERSNEVWVLRPQPAPRGDVILRNDAGDQVLRVTPDGAMTLYTAAAPQGVPVSSEGSAARLLPPTLTAVQMANFIIHQSGRATNAVGRLVIVDMEIGRGSEAVAADALSTAVEALVRMSRSAGLRQDAGRVRRIVVTDQGRPRITFARGVLTIVIDPTAGYAGRPSSARIARVISGVE